MLPIMGSFPGPGGNFEADGLVVLNVFRNLTKKHNEEEGEEYGWKWKLH